MSPIKQPQNSMTPCGGVPSIFEETDQNHRDDPHLPSNQTADDASAIVNSASGQFLIEPLAPTILHLDDYLLIDILKRLSLVELSAIGMTCQRLCAVARTVFIDIHRSQTLLLMPQKINSVFYASSAETYIKRILWCFGDLLVNVNLTLTYDWKHMQINQIGVDVLNLLVQFCAENLETIALSTNDILDECVADEFHTIVNTKLLFANAKQIKLENWFIGSGTFANCRELQVLNITNCHGLDFGLFEFPQLKAIKLKALNGIASDDLDGFLQRHQRLKKLHLSKLNEITLNVCLPYLVKLKIYKTDVELALAQFNQLKYFKTWEFDELPVEFFDQCQSTLKYLSIWNRNNIELDDEYAEKLAKCSQVEILNIFGEMNFSYLYDFKLLRKLVIRGPIQSEELIDLVPHLPNLCELIIDTSTYVRNHFVKFKESTFTAISQIYRKRNRQLIVKNDRKHFVKFALAFGDKFVEMYEQIDFITPFYYFL